MGRWSNYSNIDISILKRWSQELSYTVGLFLADGYMSNYDVRKRYYVGFSISDRDIIDKIVYLFKYDGKIYEIHDKRKESYKTIYRVVFSGEYVWKFFTKLGFDNNKSHNAKIPTDIPPKFYNHFLRGIYDGDGSITVREGKHTKYGTVDIAGNINIVRFISDLLPYFNNIRFDDVCNIYHIVFAGENAIKFLKFIYEDSTVYIDRKHSLYIDLLSSPRKFKKWTREEINFLKISYGDSNLSVKDIALKMGRSKNAINLKAERLGFRRPKCLKIFN